MATTTASAQATAMLRRVISPEGVPKRRTVRKAGRALGLELLAQVAHVHLDAVQGGVRVHPRPNPWYLAGQHKVRVAQKELEQEELGAREPKLAVTALGGHRDRSCNVRRSPAFWNRSRRRRHRGATAPAPGQQLGEGERLDQVVVRAGIQPSTRSSTASARSASGSACSRRAAARAADLEADMVPQATSSTIAWGPRSRAKAFRAIGGAVGQVSVGPQRPVSELRRPRTVLHDEHADDYIVPETRAGWVGACGRWEPTRSAPRRRGGSARAGARAGGSRAGGPGPPHGPPTARAVWPTRPGRSEPKTRPPGPSRLVGPLPGSGSDRPGPA